MDKNIGFSVKNTLLTLAIIFESRILEVEKKKGKGGAIGSGEPLPMAASVLCTVFTSNG